MFYNLPLWVRRLLRRYPAQKQVSVYTRLAVGKDMSQLAPDELGCAESVTRLLRAIDPTLTSVILGTWTLLAHMKKSPRFIEVARSQAKSGAVVMSATGTGHAGTIGHVGILIGDRVYSNNSNTGKWGYFWSLMRWIDNYQLKQGMKVRYFNIL